MILSITLITTASILRSILVFPVITRLVTTISLMELAINVIYHWWLLYYSPARSVVTQITACNNPGSNGIGQFYLFNAQQASGSGVANIPIALQFAMPNGGTSPNIANLYILGPGDFTVPSLTANASLGFPRPAAPGPLNSQWLSRFANGCGCMRWDDGLDRFRVGRSTLTCEPWEMHQLYDFAWNNESCQ